MNESLNGCQSRNVTEPQRDEESACMKLRTKSRLHTNSLSFPERGFINFSLFERKVTKEANERAARPPRRAGCRLGKFRPHLTQGFSVQMGCHREIANSPNRGFFPTKRVRQSLNFITRPARRAPYGHRRRLCVGILFSYLCPSPSRSVPPPPRGRLTNPLVLQNRPQGA